MENIKQTYTKNIYGEKHFPNENNNKKKKNLEWVCRVVYVPYLYRKT